MEEVLRGLGCETRWGGRKLYASCPFAKTTHPSGCDSRPSFVVFPDHPSGESWPPWYSCSSCGVSGSVEAMILQMWVDGVVDGPNVLFAMYEAAGPDVTSGLNATPVSAIERRRQAVERKRYTLAPRAARAKPWNDKSWVEVCAEVPELPAGYYDKFQGGVPRYALDRGLSVETCKVWDLGHDQVGRRLMFPLYDQGGRLVAVSGRLYSCRCGSTESEKEHRCSRCKILLVDGTMDCPACGGSPQKVRTICSGCKRGWPPKYLHSDGFKRNLFLYGEHLRKQVPHKVGYIVEGNADAPMMWQLGYRPVVATLGSNVLKKGQTTSVQIEKMIAWFDRVVVVHDGDEAGRKMCDQIQRGISGRIIVSSRELPDGEDPASMAKKDPQSLVEIVGIPPC